MQKCRADAPARTEQLRGTIEGEALPNGTDEHAALKEAWLERYPESEINFELADFAFFRIAPRDARFVAGFGRIHNLSAAGLIAASNGSI